MSDNAIIDRVMTVRRKEGGHGGRSGRKVRMQAFLLREIGSSSVRLA